MNKYFKVLMICILLAINFMAIAGQVVVRQSSEHFDAFAVRDQVQQDHQWQEILRMQQQLQILQALPSGCLPVAIPYRYFNCSGNAYRPYPYQDQEVFIKIDPPSS